MSQADDLLMTVEDVAVVHSHTVTDPDAYFVVDPDTRLISNMSQVPNKIMQNDHNSEIYTIEIPRVIEGHDMTKCNRVLLHFINIENGGKQQWDDVAELTLEAGGADGGLISRWLIPREATQYAGSLNFLLHYSCIDSDGNAAYEWHTDIYKDVIVAPTFSNTEAAIIPYSNILEEWYQRLFGSTDSIIETIRNEVDAQMASIEAKGAEVLASIPDDYTEANRLAHDSVRTRANAIVCTVEGSTIKLTNSSDDHVRGFRIQSNSIQHSTTGTQLFDCTTLEGIGSNADIEIYEDGYVITALGGVSAGYAFSKFPLDASKCVGRTLIMQADEITGQSQVGVMLYSFTQGSSTVNYTLKPGQTRVECPIPTDADEVKVYVYTNTTGTATTNNNTITVKGLRIGYADAPYERYSGGYPSPSPEWPQDFNAPTNPTVYISGKNMLNVTTSGVATGVTETVKDGLVSFSGTASGNGGRTAWKRSDDVLLIPGKYTISMNVPSGTAPDACLSRSDTSSIVALCGSQLTNTFIVYEPITVYLGFNYIADRSYNAKKVSVQLEAGEEATSHTGFRPIQSMTFDMPECGGTLDCLSGDITYSTRSAAPATAGSGWSPGVSASGWVHGLDSIGAETIAFHYHLGPAKEDFFPETLCTHFRPAKTWAGIVSSKTEMAYRGNGSGLSYIAIRIKRSRLVEFGFTDTNDPENAVAAFEAWLADQANNGTPVQFISQLTTGHKDVAWDPTTYLTDTVIRSDSDVKMEIDYNADTMSFLRDNQPQPTDEQIQAAVDAWLTQHFANAEGVSF